MKARSIKQVLMLRECPKSIGLIAAIIGLATIVQGRGPFLMDSIATEQGKKARLADYFPGVYENQNDNHPWKYAYYFDEPRDSIVVGACIRTGTSNKPNSTQRLVGFFVCVEYRHGFAVIPLPTVGLREALLVTAPRDQSGVVIPTKPTFGYLQGNGNRLLGNLVIRSTGSLQPGSFHEQLELKTTKKRTCEDYRPYFERIRARLRQSDDREISVDRSSYRSTDIAVPSNVSDSAICPGNGRMTVSFTDRSVMRGGIEITYIRALDEIASWGSFFGPGMTFTGKPSFALNSSYERQDGGSTYEFSIASLASDDMPEKVALEIAFSKVDTVFNRLSLDTLTFVRCDPGAAMTPLDKVVQTALPYKSGFDVLNGAFLCSNAGASKRVERMDEESDVRQKAWFGVQKYYGWFNIPPDEELGRALLQPHVFALERLAEQGDITALYLYLQAYRMGLIGTSAERGAAAAYLGDLAELDYLPAMYDRLQLAVGLREEWRATQYGTLKLAGKLSVADLQVLRTKAIQLTDDGFCAFGYPLYRLMAHWGLQYEDDSRQLLRSMVAQGDSAAILHSAIQSIARGNSDKDSASSWRTIDLFAEKGYVPAKYAYVYGFEGYRSETNSALRMRHLNDLCALGYREALYVAGVTAMGASEKEPFTGLPLRIHRAAALCQPDASVLIGNAYLDMQAMDEKRYAMGMFQLNRLEIGGYFFIPPSSSQIAQKRAESDRQEFLSDLARTTGPIVTEVRTPEGTHYEYDYFGGAALGTVISTGGFLLSRLIEASSWDKRFSSIEYAYSKSGHDIFFGILGGNLNTKIVVEEGDVIFIGTLNKQREEYTGNLDYKIGSEINQTLNVQIGSHPSFAIKSNEVWVAPASGELTIQVGNLPNAGLYLCVPAR